MPNSMKSYNGRDKRNGERRSGKDQREMIRFELDKDDRRSHKDRRASWSSNNAI